VNLAEDLRASLEDILVAGTVEIRENGSRVTSASPLCEWLRRILAESWRRGLRVMFRQ
jgi:hypothetical protein